MPDSANGDVPIKQLILVPALITLAVTLLRLTGEMMNWSPVLFGRQAGGGGAIVGIVWLVPVFGIYFALKLARMGHAPLSVARALGYPALALVLIPAAGFLAAAVGVVKEGEVSQVVFLSVVSIPAVFLAMRGWRALGRTLLAYGLAARIPVAILMLIAMLGDWGTHYDAPPPGFPAMSVWARYFLTGLMPQLTIWIAFTVIVGGIFGAFAVAVAHRRRPVPA